MRVRNRLGQRRPIELPHSVERPERVQSAQRIRARRRQLLERRYGGRIIAFDQQTLRGVAPPSVGARQASDQVLDTGLGQPWLRTGRLGFADNAVDSTQVSVLVEAAI